MPQGSSERIAEEALAEAVRRLCRGAGWEALARELAWRAVSSGARDPRRIDQLAESAGSMLGSLIDEALWTVEHSALEAWRELLESRPGDRAAALAAARLDAREEAARLVELAYARVGDALSADVPRAA